jgi:AraC-like DNA-binding protein
MAGNTALFDAPEKFEAATRELASTRLYLTGPGPFRARLTQVSLGSLRLWAVDERQPRIALLTVATETVLVTLTIDRSPVSFWGGIASHPDELITAGPGGQAQARTLGPCRWSAIWMPAHILMRYGQMLLGAPVILPVETRSWRPPGAAFRTLRALHGAAIHAAERQPDTLANAEAAHGLQQQLIHALLECLAGGPAAPDNLAARRHQDIVLRFEMLLRTQPDRRHRPDGIAAALNVSRRGLAAACSEQLGMGPAGFIRLHRVHLVHRALSDQNGDRTSVSAVARQYGFRDLGRFARSYRDLFDELPSATLHSPGATRVQA